jgi:hypothetical protein
MDTTANNYNPYTTVDDSSCFWLGCTDPFATNYSFMATVDDSSCTYSCAYYGLQDIQVIVTAGSYPNEVGWDITDVNGAIIASAQAPNGTGTFDICLPIGCYNMNMYDSYGDGWNGSIYTISGANGTIYSTGTIPGIAGVITSGGYFASSPLWCVVFQNIYGCTDPLACNYDPLANTNNGNCYYSTTSTDVQSACDSYTWLDSTTYTTSNTTATYTTTNASGCDSVITLDLTINLSPVTPQIFGLSQIIAGSLEPYLVSQSLNSTYDWGISNNGGAIVSGLPTNSIQVQWGSQNGVYDLYVIETDVNGCVGDTIFLLVTLGSSTAVDEVLLYDIMIYPNPSRDVFNITFSTETRQNLRVRIVNVVGEELISENLQQFIGEYTKQIDLTGNAKGIYFLEIETNDGMINKKLILQ